jgi:hypothetical protein
MTTVVAAAGEPGSDGSIGTMTETASPEPYGYHFTHVSPPIAELRDMARDYILAAYAEFKPDDVESVWAALDQQRALEMITAKVEISKQHRGQPAENYRAVAATLTVDLASLKEYDLDKMKAMVALVVALLGELMRETGKTAHEVLVSLPALPDEVSGNTLG